VRFFVIPNTHTMITTTKKSDLYCATAIVNGTLYSHNAPTRQQAFMYAINQLAAKLNLKYA